MMDSRPMPLQTALAAGSLMLAAFALPAAAQADKAQQRPAANPTVAPAYTASDAVQQVSEALAVVGKMKTDPELSRLLGQARGVFIVPTYGRGGWGIGVRGGEGVLVAQDKGGWSGPAFYNIAGVSIGLQAGFEAGSIAMLLMSEKALDRFINHDGFSLDAGAGLTVANYVAKRQLNIGGKDVVLWADTAGAYANASVGATDIRLDEGDMRSFYGRPATAKDVIGRAVQAPGAEALVKAMPGGK